MFADVVSRNLKHDGPFFQLPTIFRVKGWLRFGVNLIRFNQRLNFTDVIALSGQTRKSLRHNVWQTKCSDVKSIVEFAASWISWLTVNYLDRVWTHFLWNRRRSFKQKDSICVPSLNSHGFNQVPPNFVNEYVHTWSVRCCNVIFMRKIKLLSFVFTFINKMYQTESTGW